MRNIQIKRGISKDQAKKEFNKYLNSSPKSKKRLALRKEIRKMLKNESPPSHAPPHEITKHQYKKASKKKPRGAKTAKEAARKTKSPKVKQRLESAAKKYPKASVFELRHGVNSKASQDYRLRNGQGRYYEA